jgi:hypothetical protein
MQTQTDTLDQADVPRSPLERVAMPMLLFTAILAGLQIFSLLWLLPRFTQVPVAGSILPAKTVLEEERRLASELEQAKSYRNDVILPSHDEEYEILKARKRTEPSLLRIEEELRRAAALAAPEKDAIVFTHIALDSAAGTVEVSGDVRMGLRSMTVLASFVEEVGALSMTDELTAPTFERLDDGKGSVHSPFTLHLRLKPSASGN